MQLFTRIPMRFHFSEKRKPETSRLKFNNRESNLRGTHFSDSQVKFLKEIQTVLVSGNVESVNLGSWTD